MFNNYDLCFSYFIKFDYNRNWFSYFFDERKKQKCQAKDGEAKKTEKTRAVTQQRSVIL